MDSSSTSSGDDDDFERLLPFQGSALLKRRSFSLITIFFVYALGFVSGFALLLKNCSFAGDSASVQLKDNTQKKEEKSMESSNMEKSTSSLPRAKFVIAIGTEGAGHHFFGVLYGHSPSKVQLSQWGIWDLAQFDKLSQSLFNYYKWNSSLFTAPLTPDSLIVNGTLLVERVANSLQEVDSLVSNAARTSTKTTAAATGDTVTVALNIGRGDGVGMMSYPNWDRILFFPDLSATYRACELASVQCQYIVMYRDPYEVIRSTVNRRNFHNLRTALKLYATMLQVIHGQIMDEPQGLVACWDYNDPTKVRDVAVALGWNNYNNSNSNNTKGTIDTSTEAFDAIFSQLYHPPSNIDANAKEALVPPSLQIYMDTFIKATEGVKKACEEQLIQNKNK